jgi:hypothetical protein
MGDGVIAEAIASIFLASRFASTTKRSWSMPVEDGPTIG